jgi:hypothetical protein
MGYVLDGLGLIPDTGKILFFSVIYIWLWGPLSLLPSGYWGLFPWV